MSSNTPNQIGNFVIERRLGVGGMCEAFLAYRNETEESGPVPRPVVIKQLLPYRMADQNAREMLKREARVGMKLNHPNLVRYLGVDEEGTWLAMEYLAGLSLSAMAIRQWRTGLSEDLPIEIIARTVADAARGLHAAHTFTEDGTLARVIHRDVSPDNILATVQGPTKVLDFGIVRAEGEQLLTKTGEIKGKMGFFPPEMFEGQPSSPQSDVFALGVSLYWLIGRRRPFRGQHEAQIVRAVMIDTPAPVDARPDVPPELNTLVLEMLTKDPARRTQTMEEVAERLEALITTPTISGTVGRLVRHLSELGNEFDDIPRSSPGVEPDLEDQDRPPDTGVRFKMLESLDRHGTPVTQIHALQKEPGPEQQAPLDESPARPDRRRLLVAAAVGGLAVIIGLGLLFSPSETEQPPVPEQAPAESAPLSVEPPVVEPPVVAPPVVEPPVVEPPVVEPAPVPKPKVKPAPRKPRAPAALSTTGAKLKFMRACRGYRSCARRVLVKSKKLVSLPFAEARRFPEELDECVKQCLR